MRRRRISSSHDTRARERVTERTRAAPVLALTPLAAQPRGLTRAVSIVTWSLLPLVRRFARVFKIDNRIWAFGLQGYPQGTCEFEENSKYLFLGIANTFKDSSIRPVWISWTPRLATILRRRGYESYWIASPSGLKAALQAGCVFSHSRQGIAQELVGCGRALKVELWHGIPLKSVDMPVDADYAIATSESLRDLFAKCLRVPRSRVIVSGYPRDDVLLSRVRGYDIGVEESLNAVLELKKRSRIVLYAPTFRDNMVVTREEFLKYLRLDTLRLDKLLTDHDANMIVKFHPSSLRSTKVKVTDGLEKISERVHSINDPIDIYPVLCQADILVTDYSSIFFDFLFLDRPIVFYVPDYDRYLKERGFCLDFDSFTPGPKAETFEQLVTALDRTLGGEDRFVDKRRKVRDNVFDNIDGHSSVRVVGFVTSILDSRNYNADIVETGNRLSSTRS